MRKVTMVVPVLMTSCQTSETEQRPAYCPDDDCAKRGDKAVGEPEKDAMRLAN